MNELNPNDEAIVENVCASPEIKRRFLDLGLISGTRIKCVSRSPAGDPRAYLIRGAVIAIRSDDCCKITVNKKMC